MAHDLPMPPGKAVENTRDHNDLDKPRMNAQQGHGRERAKPSPPLLLYRLATPALTAHFKSPSYLKPQTQSLLEHRVLRQLVVLTSPSSKQEDGRKGEETRQQMGNSEVYWEEFVNLMKAAVPSLERRSFGIWDPSGVDYDTPSGTLISQNYPGLWRDLENIVRSVILISRNVLTARPAREDEMADAKTGQKRTRCGKVKSAQRLAAEAGADEEIMRIIRCCVRVGARGFDGPSDRANGDDPESNNANPEVNTAESRASDEEKWAHVVGAYKRVLIASLQWLNNFIAKDEHNKTVLFTKLFGEDTEKPSPPAPLTEDWTLEDVPQKPLTREQLLSRPERPIWPITDIDLLRVFGVDSRGKTLPQRSLDQALRTLAVTDVPVVPAFSTRSAARISELSKVLRRGHPAWARHFASFGPSGGYLMASKMNPKWESAFAAQHGRQPTPADWYLSMPQRWAALRDPSNDDQDPAKSGEVEMSITQQKAIRAWEQLWEAYFKKLEVWYNHHERLGLLPHWPQLEDPNEGFDDRRWRLWEEALWNRYARVEIDLAAVHEADLPTIVPEGSDRPITRHELQDLTSQQSGFTASAGKKILESGKLELMRRLEGPVSHDVRTDLQDGRAESHDIGAPDGSVLVDDQIRSKSLPNLPARSDSFERNHRDPDHPKYGPVLDDENFDEDGNPISSEVSDEGDDIGEEEVEEDDEQGSLPSLAGSTEDGRGLLTDIPLILGPSEIEVLPMLVMSCVVPAPILPQGITGKREGESDDAFHKRRLREDDEWHDEKQRRERLSTLRTRMLLSTLSGRNLLRELLIFVAAWDLHTHELYFGFITHVISHVVRLGLGGYCYWVLRDRSRSRDIISPAQGVVVKVLGSIWRNRNEAAKAAAVELERISAQDPKKPHPAGQLIRQQQLSATVAAALPTTADLGTVSHILSSFRQHTIPQTCALIFLQGQIARGRAVREDFPLNLWDMERMYEGVYGGVEVWGVLSEDVGPVATRGDMRKLIGKDNGSSEDNGNDLVTWKDVLTEWELVSELVTLLRELENGIPRGGMYGEQYQIAQGVPAVGQTTKLAHRGQVALTSSSEAQQSSPTGAASSEHADRGSQQQLPPPPDNVVPSQPAQSGRASRQPTGQDKLPVAVERPYEVEPTNALSAVPRATTKNATAERAPEPDAALAHLNTSQSVQRSGFAVVTSEREKAALAAHAQAQLLAHYAAPRATPPSNAAPQTTNPPLAPAELAASPAYAQYPPEDALAYGDELEEEEEDDDDDEHDADEIQQDEPSAFEWRNLKKLTVLVLSSLVWKNPRAQKQVRDVGGLEVLVQCASERGGFGASLEEASAGGARGGNEGKKAVVDEGNVARTSYRVPAANPASGDGDDDGSAGLREHAQMCLKFAVEGCEENARYVAGIRGGVEGVTEKGGQ